MTTEFEARVASNSRIIVGLHVATQVIRFVGILFIQRLVAPAEYGLMGVVIGVIIGLEMISDIGIGPSIIQNKRGSQPSFYRTAWVLQIVRGILLGLIAVALGLLLAHLQHSGFIGATSNYANPTLPPVLMVLGITLLLASCNSTSLHVYTRRQRLLSVSLIELYAQIAALIVTLIWASQSPTVWALVAGAITRAAAKTVLSYIMLRDVKMSVEFEKEDALSIYRFGRWIFLGSIATFLAQYGDRFFMNAYLTETAFGLYVSAVMLIDVFRSLAIAIQSKVFYPLFGDVHRRRPDEITSTYYRVRFVFDFGLSVLTGAIILGSPSVIGIAFGEQYHGASTYVPILAVGLIGMGPALASSLLAARGFPKAETIYLAARLCIILFGLPIVYRYFGTAPIVWVIALNAILPLPILYYFMHRERLLRPAFELRGLLGLPIGLGLGAGLHWLLNSLLPSMATG